MKLIELRKSLNYDELFCTTVGFLLELCVSELSRRFDLEKEDNGEDLTEEILKILHFFLFFLMKCSVPKI
jgi:hypothetical protein